MQRNGQDVAHPGDPPLPGGLISIILPDASLPHNPGFRVFMTPLAFSYDSEHDILTIEGRKYSGDLFREFGFGPTEEGKCFKLKIDHGCMTIYVQDHAKAE